MNFIKNFFNKEHNSDKEYIDSSEIDTDVVESFDYDTMDDVEYLSEDIDEKDVLLLVDDLEDQFFLYEMDFKNIKSKFDCSIYDEYLVCKSSGEMAGFSAIKFINNTDRLDVAILDITLGKSIKLSNGEYIDIDGVDIGLSILKKFPRCKVVFCSAHPLNRRNPDIHSFMMKWEDSTGIRMEDVYFNKNSDRHKYIYDLLDKC